MADNEELRPDRLHLWPREVLEERCRQQREEIRGLREQCAAEREAAEATRDSHERLAEKLQAYEAGAEAYDQGDAWGKELTPGQQWHRLLNSTEDQRLALLLRASENTRTAAECLMMDHKGLARQLDLEREQLSIAVFDMPTDDTAAALTVAVRALRQVMVDGIAARGSEVTYAVREPEIDDLPGFPQEKGVAEKIAEQLADAGIELGGRCGWEWPLSEGDAAHSLTGAHKCVVTNPLHVGAHSCALIGCGATQTHEEAEAMMNDAGMEAGE